MESADRTHRDAAMQVFETLTDYFNHRRLLACSKPRPIILVHTEMAIAQRTRARLDAVARHGAELETAVHVH